MASPWLVGVFGIVFAGWLINISPSFKKCIQTEKNDPTYQTLRENPSVVQGSLVRVELHSVCVEDWTKEYEGAIGAVATVFIAIFTLTLWEATKRLWQSFDGGGNIRRTGFVRRLDPQTGRFAITGDTDDEYED